MTCTGKLHPSTRHPPNNLAICPPTHPHLQAQAPAVSPLLEADARHRGSHADLASAGRGAPRDGQATRCRPAGLPARTHALMRLRAPPTRHPLHPLCTRSAPALHPLCTRYARAMHPLCTPYAPPLQPLCRPSCPSSCASCARSLTFPYTRPSLSRFTCSSRSILTSRPATAASLRPLHASFTAPPRPFHAPSTPPRHL